MSKFSITLYFFLSYMDTEQFEEAVRDYEKVYQTEKTKGMRAKGWSLPAQRAVVFLAVKSKVG